MASPDNSPPLEIRHKSQQSHDSGAYIDWNSDSGSPTRKNSGQEGDISLPYLASNVTGEFVTVVAVESSASDDSGKGTPSSDRSSTIGEFSECRGSDMDMTDAESPFVTVLSIGNEAESTKDKVSLSVAAPDEVPLVKITEVKCDADPIPETEDEERVEDVLVYRLPGERLGFALKFDGGVKTAELVKRLFIQSCAPDSPASRANCSWGSFKEGDEIIEIDDVAVNSMTRLDCVRCLKESNMVIKLRVRHPKFPVIPNTNGQTSRKHRNSTSSIEEKCSSQHGEDNEDNISICSSSSQKSTVAPCVVSEVKKRSPPPPIPPRKVPRRSPAPPPKDSPSVIGPPKGFADGDSSETTPVPRPRASTPQSVSSQDSSSTSSRETTPKTPRARITASPRSMSKQQHSPEIKHIPKRAPLFPNGIAPPEAEVYLDLLAQEDHAARNAESESDDTGSSISTIVDRLSLNSASMPTTTNSSFSDTCPQPKSSDGTVSASTQAITTTVSTSFDLAKVLSPFEQLEREFSDADFLLTKLVSSTDNTTADSKPEEDLSLAGLDSVTLQPPISFQDAPLSYGNEEVRSGLRKTEDFADNIDSIEAYAADDSYVVKVEVESQFSLCNGHVEELENTHNSLAKSKNCIESSTDAPVLPPKPSPRKEGSRFRSGKKRPPPPPPPPRKERPQPPQPPPDKEEETKETLATVTSQNKPPDVIITSVSQNGESAHTETISAITTEDQELDNPVVVEDEPSIPVAPFHWSINQLATIGEDEEEQLEPENISRDRRTPLTAEEKVKRKDADSSATQREAVEAARGVVVLGDTSGSASDAGPSGVRTSEPSEEHRSLGEPWHPVEGGKGPAVAGMVKDCDRGNRQTDRDIIVVVTSEDGEKEQTTTEMNREDSKDIIVTVTEVDQGQSALMSVEGELERSLYAEVELDDLRSSGGAPQRLIKVGCQEVKTPTAPSVADDFDRTSGEEDVERHDQFNGYQTASCPQSNPCGDEEFLQEDVQCVAPSSVSLQEPDTRSDAQSADLVDDVAPSDISNDTGLGTMDSLVSLESSTISHGYSQSLDDSLPPSFSRLPPDGHEFPPNYQEPVNLVVPSEVSAMDADLSLEKGTVKQADLISSHAPASKSHIQIQGSANDKVKSSPPPLPVSSPPRQKPEPKDEDATKEQTARRNSSNLEESVPSPKKLPGRAFSSDTVGRRLWKKDEKSECSVRDKIAMFSRENSEEVAAPSPPQPSSRKLGKFKSSEDVTKIATRTNSLSFEEDRNNMSSKFLSKSIHGVDTVGCNGQTSVQPPAPLYKGSIFNSMSDVSASNNETKESGPRSFDYTRARSTMDLTSSSSSCSPDSSLSSASSYYSGNSSSGSSGYSTLPRQQSRLQSQQSSPKYSLDKKETLTRTSSFSSHGGSLHSRSQSLVDVASTKRHSLAGYSTIGPNYVSSAEQMRRQSLNALIEQRRKSMSKLRGLVIPEKTEVPTTRSLYDLPEIKSRDSILTAAKPEEVSPGSQRRWENSLERSSRRNSMSAITSNGNRNISTDLSSPPWKSQSPATNVPKYSPAFKRKSLAVYATSISTPQTLGKDELRQYEPGKLAPPSPTKQTRPIVHNLSLNSTSPLGPEPKSLESITSPRSDSSFEFSSGSHVDGSSPELVTRVKDDHTLVINGSLSPLPKRMSSNSKNKSTNLGKRHSVDNFIHVTSASRGSEDSDNDSAVSSSRSSISHGYSPPSSPLPGETTESRHRNNVLDGNHHRHSLSSDGQVERRPVALRRTLSSETTASVSSATSTASTLTSGSQGSAGSDGSNNKRVLKPQSVEAINRKNVLSSAKYSSGCDLKIGSPLIQRKFEEDEDTEAKDEEDDDEDVPEPKYSLSRKLSNGTDYSIRTGKEAHGFAKNADELTPPCNTEVQVAYMHEIVGEHTVSDSNGPSDIEKEIPVPQARRLLSETQCSDGSLSDCSESLKSDSSSGEETHKDSSGSYSYSNHTDRWNELERKYRSGKETETQHVESRISHYRSRSVDEVDNEEVVAKKVTQQRPNVTNLRQKDGKSFKSIAEKWQQISSDTSFLPVPTAPPSAAANKQQEKTRTIERKQVSAPHQNKRNSIQEEDNTTKEPQPRERESAMPVVPDRKMSVPECPPVKMRDRKDSLPSRPTSLVEPGDNNKPVEPPVPAPRTEPKSMECPRQPPRRSDSRELLDLLLPSHNAGRASNNRRSVSVNDIRKAFEKAEMALTNSAQEQSMPQQQPQFPRRRDSRNGLGLSPNHVRVSSLDSTTSEESSTPAHYGSVSSLASNQREQFGSITSLASSTSLISQQELQQLIDEANQSLEESGTPVGEVLVIVLHRELAGSSVGITLAGGADYEAKEITVHKVLAGSPADRDGRIQKGDRILSINGRSMKGVTHREALSILKAPRPEVVLVVCRSDSTQDGVDEAVSTLPRSSINRPPRILEQPADSGVLSAADDASEVVPRGPPMYIMLIKDGAGLGFSLEGGKDSPLGDKPLTVKKIFTGGSAEKNGELHVGDELLAVNDTDVTNMSRIEAWALMKKLPDGSVTLTVKHKLEETKA